MLREERERGHKAWYYISFADGTLPKGTQFLGAVVVEGYGVSTAIQRAHELGINPGGEALTAAWPDHVPLPAEGFRNRLLNRAEAEGL